MSLSNGKSVVVNITSGYGGSPSTVRIYEVDPNSSGKKYVMELKEAERIIKEYLARHGFIVHPSNRKNVYDRIKGRS